MTIRDYLMFIAAEPLLLRLSIAAILTVGLFAAHAISEKLLRCPTPRPPTPVRSPSAEPPREIVGVPHFY
jgi:hypothetical protein